MLYPGMCTNKLEFQYPTCRKSVVKRAQHVASNNVAICCVDRLRTLGGGFTVRLYFVTGPLGIQTDEAKTAAVSWFWQCIVYCSFGKLTRILSYPEKISLSQCMHALNSLPFEGRLINLDNFHTRKLNG